MLLERYVKMSSGRQISNMVADQRVAEMIETARTQYDYIILDLPPLQAAPDAEFVMQYADASLLVVQQNLVRASIINKAITSLQKGKAELIGCVLNNVFSLAYIAPRTAGTGYGYGYGHYGNYGKNKKAAASTGKRSGS
jgi:Mrp family chromosome partitioning ATPase